METSMNSQLKSYAVKRFHIDDETGSYDMLRVVCPHCSGEFWVQTEWVVLHPVSGRDDDPPAYPFGRQCPYGGCYRVAAVPVELRIRHQPAPPKRRRKVKRRKTTNT